MKTLHYCMTVILLCVNIAQIPISSQAVQQNSSNLSYKECQNQIGIQMQNVVESIDKIKAVSLAVSSSEFQSKVSGYKYVFSGIFTNMTENQETCNDVKLKSIAVEFSILNSTSNFVKFIEVGEDPSMTQIIFVEDVFVQKCDNNCPPPSPPVNNALQEPLASPLRQIASGVAPKDVTCKEGLQLVIKSTDKSPACLQPDTAYQMIYRGWAKEFVQSVLDKFQFSACESTLAPPGDHKTNVFPVLMMSPNSTATVCVTYKFQSDWDSYPNKDTYPHGILETCCFIHMENSTSSEFSNRFQVLANPLLYNVTGVTNGSKVIVMYKIHAGPNSKGYYDTSIPFDYCESYPLAVGYGSSDVDATKFHPNFDIPCYYTIDTVDSVKIVSGMTFKEVQFP